MRKGADIDALLRNLARLLAEEVTSLGQTSARHLSTRLLTVEQAATYLGRTRNAVEHMVSCGKIPRVKSDRRVFLDVKDLDEWIQDNKERAI